MRRILLVLLILSTACRSNPTAPDRLPGPPQPKPVPIPAPGCPRDTI